MRRTRAGRTSRNAAAAGVALLLSAIALAGCGESSQEKARSEVCSARSAISAEVNKLQSLTLSSSTVDEVKSGLEKIGDELTKIKDAQSDLAPERKEQVEKATSEFGDEVATLAVQVAADLAGGTGEAALDAAKPKLKSAVETLASDYRKSLGPISC